MYIPSILFIDKSLSPVLHQGALLTSRVKSCFTYKCFVCLFIMTLLCLSGCAFYPKVADEQNTECHLVSKKLTVDVVVLQDISSADLGGASGEGLVVLLAGTAVVAVGSAIISGSITLVGNTIHWIEQEGTCDDGMIKTAIDNVSKSLSSLGGRFVGSVEDIIRWIKSNKARKFD
jgi:hypothetical protein